MRQLVYTSFSVLFTKSRPFPFFSSDFSTFIHRGTTDTSSIFTALILRMCLRFWCTPNVHSSLFLSFIYLYVSTSYFEIFPLSPCVFSLIFLYFQISNWYCSLVYHVFLYFFFCLTFNIFISLIFLGFLQNIRFIGIWLISYLILQMLMYF